MLEEWEVADFRARFAPQRRTRLLNEHPIGEFHEPGHAFLFDFDERTTPQRRR